MGNEKVYVLLLLLGILQSECVNSLFSQLEQIINFLKFMYVCISVHIYTYIGKCVLVM